MYYEPEALQRLDELEESGSRALQAELRIDGGGIDAVALRVRFK